MSEHVKRPEADNPDPQGRSTFVVGIVGVLITVLTFIGLEVVYYRTAVAEFTRKEVQAVSPELEAMLAEQQQELESYRWVDQSAGVVAVPIQRAMELVVQEHGNR